MSVWCISVCKIMTDLNACNSLPACLICSAELPYESSGTVMNEPNKQYEGLFCSGV